MTTGGNKVRNERRGGGALSARRIAAGVGEKWCAPYPAPATGHTAGGSLAVASAAFMPEGARAFSDDRQIQV